MKISFKSLTIKNLLLILVRLYQILFSPLKISKCPFLPTCSNYMHDALQEYGVLKGLILGLWRLLRCNPFNKGYYDPPKFWGEKLHFKPLKKRNV